MGTVLIKKLHIPNSYTFGLLTAFWQSRLLGSEVCKQEVSLPEADNLQGYRLNTNNPQLIYLSFLFTKTTFQKSYLAEFSQL